MSLKAHIRNDASGNITIHMEGGLDFDSVIPFRHKLEELNKKNPTAMLTLDLNHLDFVGSCGIGQFVDTIKSLQDRKFNFQLQNVKEEFVKVFKLYEVKALENLIVELESDETIHLAQTYATRTKTFEN